MGAYSSAVCAEGEANCPANYEGEEPADNMKEDAAMLQKSPPARMNPKAHIGVLSQEKSAGGHWKNGVEKCGGTGAHCKNDFDCCSHFLCYDGVKGTPDGICASDHA